MCGRFSFAPGKNIIEEYFGFVPENYQARYNCTPSQTLAVISNQDTGGFSYFKWGFVPFWAKDLSVGSKMINARAETVSALNHAEGFLARELGQRMKIRRVPTLTFVLDDSIAYSVHISKVLNDLHKDGEE